MLTEQQIYGTQNSYFSLAASMIPELSTYNVSPDYGKNINTENLEQYLKDPNYGVSSLGEDKYPLCVCMTPKSKIINYGEVFFFSLFFIRRSFVSSIDTDINTSTINIYVDWSDMKQIAIKFINLLRQNLNLTGPDTELYRKNIGFGSEPIDVRRLSNFTVDNVSGVSVNFTFNATQILC